MSLDREWASYYSSRSDPKVGKPLGWNPRNIFAAGYAAGRRAADPRSSGWARVSDLEYLIKQTDEQWELWSVDGSLWGGFDTHAEAVDYMDWLIANPRVIERARRGGAFA